ncbi:MAG: AIPR family protein, partial [Gemmatimonadetes bacterium]|nr:AIPR family protein [Gemmatimonadota bacterium]
KEKVVRLLAPSIINGSQTQGIVRQYANGLASAGMPLPSIHVKFEIIVTDDDALVADVSIARNFQNDVAPVSIVGRKGQLEELDAVLKARFGEVELRKSETEISRALSLKEDYIFTEKLMQVMTALVPDSLWWGPGGAEAPNKAYTYSAKARCLKDFSRIYEAAKNPNHPEHLIAARRYQFFLEIAPQAIELYEEWKTHQGFAGTGLRSILRDGRSVEEVPDGMVFPILAALSKFAKRTSKGWKIVRPSQFRDSDLIGAVKRTYMHVAKSNPNTMGKSFACYAALYEITGIYQRLIHESPEAFE